LVLNKSKKKKPFLFLDLLRVAAKIFKYALFFRQIWTQGR
jgi:hypothetical protein